MTEPAPALAPSDAELLDATRSGDTAAYGQLYERHLLAAKSLARQLVHGAADTDDVVAEAFARVLDLLRRGGGPVDGFRPYLLTAVRRVAYDRYRGERRQVAAGAVEELDPGQPFIDPAVEDLERSLIARAFGSLPERWRAVLWHTEIEDAKPADVAPLLGLTANGVAALSYQAREGLRQAYLQMHLSVFARHECRPTLAKLGAYVRGGLSKRDTDSVNKHLDRCEDCRAVYAELTDVNSSLRGMVAPIFLGPAAAAYLAGRGGAGWLARPVRWLRHAPKQQAVGLAGVAAAVALTLVLATLLTENKGSPVGHHHPAAAPPGSTPPSAPGRPGPHRQAFPPQTPPSAARPATQPPAGQPALVAVVEARRRRAPRHHRSPCPAPRPPHGSASPPQPAPNWPTPASASVPQPRPVPGCR
jgi:RNA polymerase sigma factor (sigma-70 family)